MTDAFDTKKKPETLEEATLRICSNIMEQEGRLKLAREFRLASCKEVLSKKARKIYNEEAGIVELFQ